MKVVRGLANIVSWCFVAFCFLVAFAYDFVPESIISLLVGISAMPVKATQNIWEKVLKKKKWLKPIALAVLFIVACMVLPETQEGSDPGSQETIQSEMTVTPVPTAEPTIAPTETDAPTPEPTATKDPQETLTPTPEPTVTNTPTPEPTATSTPTPKPTATNTPISEPTATNTPTPKPTATSTPTPKPTATSTPTPQPTATPVPTQSAELTTDFSILDITLEDIPAYTSEPYVVINNNEPFFRVSSDMTESFEFYSDLDSLGRCGVAYANIGVDIMPTEERESIGSVKPTGWQTVKYDIVDGKYLYNRCHLIGFQLTGENANRQNLITGTRYMNVIGMLPFENLVDDYIEETGNHVMYRVLPMFDGDNLVAHGVLMEAWSVEDEGEGICFNVFVYNIQPGITIDYETGESALSEDAGDLGNSDEAISYVLNISSKKFHEPTCKYAESISYANRRESTATREELIEQGYSPCGVCKP